MRRREFITLLGGAAAWPVAARAQQTAVPVIGFLSSGSPEVFALALAAFRDGLQEAGYREGRNVAIEYRWADADNDRLPELATDLVRRQVTVIAAFGPPAALAAKRATTTIPIVTVTGVDPVTLGLVTTLNRPGGNVTGVVTLSGELGPKRLELMHELVPATTVMALLVNPTNPSTAETQSRDLQVAARTMGLQLHVLHASSEHDVDTVFATLVELRVGALVIASDPFFNAQSKLLAFQALRHAVPAIYQYREFVAAGGLMSYGANLADLYRPVGTYAGRILKGEKPAELPVQRSTKVELFINLKTANAFGLTVPLPLLGRADEVIE
jgi:putative tryptophan/tyrosine transport system substrate-binding protein